MRGMIWERIREKKLSYLRELPALYDITGDFFNSFAHTLLVEELSNVGHLGCTAGANSSAKEWERQWQILTKPIYDKVQVDDTLHLTQTHASFLGV